VILRLLSSLIGREDRLLQASLALDIQGLRRSLGCTPTPLDSWVGGEAKDLARVRQRDALGRLLNDLELLTDTRGWRIG